MGKKFKINSQDRKIIKETAAKLNPCVQIGHNGEPVMEVVTVKGEELIKQGTTSYNTYVLHKGPNKSKNSVQVTRVIKPDEYYPIEQYKLLDPEKFLENYIKANGYLMEPALKAYNEVYKKSTTRMTEIMQEETKQKLKERKEDAKTTETEVPGSGSF